MPPLIRGYKLLQVITCLDEKSSVDLLMKMKPIHIRVRDARATIALHFAAMKGLPEIIRLLTKHLQHQAVLNVPASRKGDTALFAVVRYHREEGFQLLLGAGPNCNLRNIDGDVYLFGQSTVKEQA